MRADRLDKAETAGPSIGDESFISGGAPMTLATTANRIG